MAAAFPQTFLGRAASARLLLLPPPPAHGPAPGRTGGSWAGGGAAAAGAAAAAAAAARTRTILPPGGEPPPSRRPRKGGGGGAGPSSLVGYRVARRSVRLQPHRLLARKPASRSRGEAYRRPPLPLRPRAPPPRVPPRGAAARSHAVLQHAFVLLSIAPRAQPPGMMVYYQARARAGVGAASAGLVCAGPRPHPSGSRSGRRVGPGAGRAGGLGSVLSLFRTWYSSSGISAEFVLVRGSLQAHDLFRHLLPVLSLTQ